MLSEELKVAVMDRSALILDIFAQRARTREGRLQVELAQYKYLLPRLLECGPIWSGRRAPSAPAPRRDPAGDRPAAHPQKDRQAGGRVRDVRRVRATQRERRIKNEVRW